ncbi:MAG: hypothetical protein DDT21_02754 [Syntrophomonadaceae bacterium]|nr:hypothetical protein [Bacillota bacterium]
MVPVPSIVTAGAMTGGATTPTRALATRSLLPATVASKAAETLAVAAVLTMAEPSIVTLTGPSIAIREMSYLILLIYTILATVLAVITGILRKFKPPGVVVPRMAELNMRLPLAKVTVGMSLKITPVGRIKSKLPATMRPPAASVITMLAADCSPIPRPSVGTAGDVTAITGRIVAMFIVPAVPAVPATVTARSPAAAVGETRIEFAGKLKSTVLAIA